MKKWSWLLAVLTVFALSKAVLAQDAATTEPAAAATTEKVAAKPAAGGQELVVADFDSGDKPNNLSGDFGAWDKDPNDETQSCKMSFAEDDALGDALGYSLKFVYDVDSPNPAYNGFWMKLNNLDATAYNTVNFYMKGEGVFTKRVKIEMKDSSGKSSPFIVSGITDQWQKFSIPFEKFSRIQNWNSLSEIVVVFDDMNSNPKTGTIYLDQVTLSKE